MRALFAILRFRNVEKFRSSDGFGAQDARGSVARPELLQNQLAPCCEKAAVPHGGSALLSEALVRMQASFTAGFVKAVWGNAAW